MQIITLSRKPLLKTAIHNIQETGCGSINIDDTRISIGGDEDVSTLKPFGDMPSNKYGGETGFHRPWMKDKKKVVQIQQEALDRMKQMGRFPANLILRDDVQCAFPDTGVSTGGRSFQTTSQIYGGYFKNNWTHDDPGYGDSGSAARFFFNSNKDNEMISGTQIPKELFEYLQTMINPPLEINPLLLVLLPEGDAFYDAMEDLNWDRFQDEEFHGVLAYGDLSPYVDQLWRVLKPGAHIVSFPDEDCPSNYKNACLLEDGGFEIRDGIAWLEEAGDMYYVPKASVSEKNLGCADLTPKQRDTGRKKGNPGGDNPRNRGVNEKTNFHPCLHPDEWVMTDRGWRKISEMTVGDNVYTSKGEFHPVECVSHHQYMHPVLYQIHVAGTNQTVRASNNHPFLIWRPARKDNRIVGGEVLWVEAADLQKGDYTMTPTLNTEPSFCTDDAEFWFLFGLYLADGVLQKAGHGENVYPSYTLHQEEKVLHDRIKRYFDRVSIYPKENSQAVQVLAFDPEVGSLFKELGGQGASTKSIHPLVWTLEEKCRRSLLEGYLAGDGGFVRSWMQAKTVSNDLSAQISFLAESVGYKTTWDLYEGTGGGIGDREFKSTKPCWTLRFYDRNLKQSNRRPSKPTKLEYQGITYTLRYVQKVEHVPYQGHVWNLTVSKDPTFQTIVGMSHNTVKPMKLGRLLAELVPEGTVIVDPFSGSGSFPIAYVQAGRSGVGLEREEEYLEISTSRAKYWLQQDVSMLDVEFKTDLEETEETAVEEIPFWEAF